jgi:hypothetical protein
MTIGVMGFVAPLSRRTGVRTLEHWLGLAAGTDSRHRSLNDLCRGRLRSDDRNRLQQDRDRQDHSGGLLHK